MHSKLPGQFFLLILFVLLANCRLGAQSVNNIPPDSSFLIEYSSAFEKFERQNQVHFFYKPEWFINRKIPAYVANFPLSKAIDWVCSSTSLSFVVLDSNSIVFVPKDTPPVSVNPDQEEFLLIGNPAESGKTTVATLSGAIKDGKSNDPLPGAIITTDKQKVIAVSDRNGYFTMNLAVGEHVVTVKFMGYEELNQKIKIVSNGNHDFQVFEKSVQLNTVIITDERSDLNISRTRMSAIRLDAKAIRELPTSLGEKDILKSVVLLPGVQSVGDFGSGFIVRGGNADQNLILVEDVPLFNSSHLFGLTSIINPDVLSSVTLLKAGIPARYGERASSVLDIRLGPANADALKAKGGIGLLNSRLSLEVPLMKKKGCLVIGGRSSYSDWLLHRIPDIDLKNSGAGFYDLNGLLTINPDPKNKIVLMGYYSSDRFSFTSSTKYNYSNLLASVRWNHVVNKHLSLNISGGTSQYRFSAKEMDSLRLYDANRIDISINYYDAKCAFNWFPNDKHAFEFGINGILYKTSPGELLPYGENSIVMPRKTGMEKGLETSAFLSDNFTITSRFGSEAGIRVVRYTSLGPGYEFLYKTGLPRSVENIYDTAFYGSNQSMGSYFSAEPRLSLRFTIDEERSVKLSYTRMTQFINLLSNTSVISPTDSWKLSDHYFRPLSCDQYALGYFRNFLQNAIETSVEVYYKSLANVMEYRNGAQILLNDHLETDMVDAMASAYGIELYVNKVRGKLTGWLSYTFSRSLTRTSGSLQYEKINDNKFFPSNFDIPHNLVINLNYHLSRRWRFSSTFTYHTGRPVTLPELKYEVNGNQLIWFSDRNKYRLPDYHRLDLAITLDQSLKLKRKWKSSWTLSIVNLYGRKNAYSAFYAKDDPRSWRYNGDYHLYTMYILGVPLPTITYNFSF